MNPCILSLSTAVPSFSFNQEALAEKLIEELCLSEEKNTLIRNLHKNSSIDCRYSVVSHLENSSTFERNEIYKEKAVALALAASLKALKAWGGNPDTLTHIISVSCTGLFAPGIEFELMEKLRLNPSIERLAINFMGCFGAFKGLSVAASFAKENPKNRILLVCTELCSLHFQKEGSSDNLLGNSLFADGAGAAIIGIENSTETPLWEIYKKQSFALENTKDKMSWTISNHGFLMTLSSTVPVYIKRNIASFMSALLPAGVSYKECAFALHPGGKSILQAIEKALCLDKSSTQSSWDILKNYGNMSSASFLFVLEKLLEEKSKKTWTLGTAFGPGLSIEGMLFKNRPLSTGFT